MLIVFYLLWEFFSTSQLFYLMYHFGCRFYEEIYCQAMGYILLIIFIMVCCLHSRMEIHQNRLTCLYIYLFICFSCTFLLYVQQLEAFHAAMTLIAAKTAQFYVLIFLFLITPTIEKPTQQQSLHLFLSILYC